MKHCGIAFLCLFLSVILPISATDYGKMSCYVSQLVNKQKASPYLSRGETPQRPRTLIAFLRIDPAEASNVYRLFGCQQYARYGDLAIVGIPVNKLPALSEHPAVHRIEASPSSHLTMDNTVVVTAVDKVQQSFNSNWITTPYTGRGVVVGVMDVGFDLTHPNFYDSSTSNYRIGAFWDQLSRDTTDSNLPVGRDFVGANNVKSQLHSYDGLIQTHGTHTLGIAAGSGYNSPYRGIAYEADICLVSNAISSDIELIDSADYYKYTSATDALGFKYIFDYAEKQGKPCVASFSEGYPPYLDEEDSLFAAFLDSLSGPGRIIVASAGNEGVVNTYAEKTKGTASAGAFVQTLLQAALYRIKADGTANLNIYAYCNDDSHAPTDTIRLSTTDIPVDSVLTDTLFLQGDTCTIYAIQYPSGFDGNNIINIAFEANKLLTALPPLAIVAEGADAYVQIFGSSNYALANLQTDPRWCAAQPGHNIHAPACFPSVIAVGSTVHRTGFTNYKGEYKDFSKGCVKGMHSGYSSTGPAMNGIMKPEISAPGNNIISSYSSYYIEANPGASDINSDVEHFDFEGRTYAWNANSGTSMSTPVVAGIIALWLQAKPNLTNEDIVRLFSQSSRHPDTTLTYPNNEYGYGEINAYNGLLNILGIDRIETNFTRQCQQQTYRIYTIDGCLVSVLQSSLPTTISSLQLPPGVYVVKGNNESRNEAKKIVISK